MALGAPLRTDRTVHQIEGAGDRTVVLASIVAAAAQGPSTVDTQFTGSRNDRALAERANPSPTPDVSSPVVI